MLVNVTVLTLNSTLVTLIWNPPLEIDQNGPITAYHICYNDSSLNSVKSSFVYQVPAPIVYPANSSVSINKTFSLQLPDGLYTWYVTAENGAGISADSNTISERVISNILTDASIYVVSAVSTSFGLLLFCCVIVSLVHSLLIMIFCWRRYSDKKMKNIEATTVEMKTRTIFSNVSNLKELEENEAPKEAIYAVIGRDQFPGASAARDAPEVVVANPLQTPQLFERRESSISTLEREFSLIIKSGLKGVTSLSSIEDESNDDTLKEVDESVEDSLKEDKNCSIVETKVIDLEKTEWEEGELPALPLELAQIESAADVSYHPYDNFPDQGPK